MKLNLDSTKKNLCLYENSNEKEKEKTIYPSTQIFKLDNNFNSSSNLTSSS